MTTRERFQAVMGFQPFDRLPLVEWALWWHLTLERWRGEGLPATPATGDPLLDALEERYRVNLHFGHDLYLQDWPFPFAPGRQPQPASHGAPVIESMDDYERLLPDLYPDPAAVLHRARWEHWVRLQARGDAVLWFSLGGFFWFPRELLGIEPHLYAFYDEPELMHRINADLAAWHLRYIDAVCEICTPDFMTFAEDMSYNHGPMVSEPIFDEFLLPYYRQVIPRLKERGILAIIDSDGDVTQPCGWFGRAGLDGILPLERQAGVSVERLRGEHPRMRFIGHFDKLTMHQGEAAMRAEFERHLPAAAKGGFILSVDHQTPPGVSYQDYQLYMRLFREYAPLAG